MAFVSLDECIAAIKDIFENNNACDTRPFRWSGKSEGLIEARKREHRKWQKVASND